ncbi:hypothetical protein GBAR_LOCUS27817 [Geodia barretti]|uniref:Uncharacterized protein n=1 Tax=Geodia barretti TaxID=519541 RepID=A0AA35XFQ0_GEOBA|nr:hypothetical protein GBAR_LOCUS27817 [Geodia barretti]
MFCSPSPCEKYCRHKAKSSCTQNENKDTSLPSGSSLAHTTIIFTAVIPPPLFTIELSADNCLRSGLSCFPLDGANGPLTASLFSLATSSLLLLSPSSSLRLAPPLCQRRWPRWAAEEEREPLMRWSVSPSLSLAGDFLSSSCGHPFLRCLR